MVSGVKPSLSLDCEENDDLRRATKSAPVGSSGEQCPMLLSPPGILIAKTTPILVRMVADLS